MTCQKPRAGKGIRYFPKGKLQNELTVAEISNGIERERSNISNRIFYIPITRKSD